MSRVALMRFYIKLGDGDGVCVCQANLGNARILKAPVKTQSLREAFSHRKPDHKHEDVVLQHFVVKLGEMQGNQNPDRGRAAVFRDCASLSDFSSTPCRTASTNPASAPLYTLCTAQIVVSCNPLFMHFLCFSNFSIIQCS